MKVLVAVGGGAAQGEKAINQSGRPARSRAHLSAASLLCYNSAGREDFMWIVDMKT